MKSLVVYDSEFGNTEQVARAIAAVLREAGPSDVRSLSDATSFAPDIELLIVGGPTHAHGIDAAFKTFLETLPDTWVNGIEVATFDTRYRMPELVTGSAAHAIAKRLTRKGAHLLDAPKSFFVEHKEGPLVDGELERAAAWAGDLVASVAKDRRVGSATESL